jgi:enterochelin esterase-like enzyme
LPAGYPKCAPAGGYPVIFLLHGDPGERHSWLTVGSQELFDAAHASDLGAYIVVYPDGAGPWTDWSDSADGSWRMGSFITTDLVNYVDHNYATNADPGQRFIGGLSSGGFGAASLALAHPSTFGGFLAFSGYFRTGLSVSRSRPIPAAISPDALTAHPEDASMHVFVGTGLQDGTYTVEAMRYRDQVTATALDLQYMQEPGGHGTHLWRDLLWQALSSMHRWTEQDSRKGQVAWRQVR